MVNSNVTLGAGVRAALDPLPVDLGVGSRCVRRGGRSTGPLRSTAYGAGLRVSEVVAVKVGDVDSGPSTRSNGAGTFARQPEAVKQAAVADRLLLTKTDLAKPAGQQAFEARLAALNPSALVIPVAQGAVDPSLVFNLGFFDPATKSVDVRRWLRDEAFASRDGHDHDDHHLALSDRQDQPG